jgi:hypothetical protein
MTQYQTPLPYSQSTTSTGRGAVVVLAICAIIIALVSMAANITYLGSSLTISSRFYSNDKVMAIQVWISPVFSLLADITMLVAGITALIGTRAAWHVMIAYLGALMLASLVAMTLYSLRVAFPPTGAGSGSIMIPQTFLQSASALHRLFFYIVLMVLITRAPVKFIIQSAITGRSDPAAM